MAAASYNTDLTDLVADSATTSNWAALGGGASGLNIETDYFIEGTRCVSKNAWAGAEKGMVEDTTVNTLTALSGNGVYMWVTHLTPGSLAAKASGGIAIQMGSASNTLNKYNYAGSDTIDYGAPWICAVVDPDEATQTSGTVTTANIDTYGATANLPSGGPTKGAPFGIDEIRYGRSIEINDGVGAAANFTDLAVQNDSINNRWGQFQRTPGSATNFTMQCRLEFGDTTNTVACEFEDSSKNITINNLEHVATDFIEFDVTQGSDVTLSSCGFTATAAANTRGNWVTTSAGTVVITSCSFSNMGTFGLSSGYTITGSTFRGCDLITQNAATITGSTIATSTATSALLIDDASKITSNTFEGDGTTTPGHAVDLGTVSGGTSGAPITINWSNSLDNGATNQTTWEGSTQGQTLGTQGTANDAITVNVTSGSFCKIAVGAGATIPTVQNTGTGTLEITANEVTLTVTVVDIDTGSPLEGAMVYVTNTGAVATYINKVETNASGQVSHTTSLGSAQTLVGRVRAATPGSKAYTKYYKTSPVAGTFSNTADTDITIQLIPDE